MPSGRLQHRYSRATLRNCSFNIQPMLTSEKRRSQRIQIDGLPVAGEMCLIRGTGRVPVKGIKDLSDTGISVYVDQAIAVRESVTIEYADRGIRLEVFGTVTWHQEVALESNAPAWTGRYLIGIELVASSILTSAILNNHGSGKPR